MELIHLYPLDFELKIRASLDLLSPMELALVQFHPDTTPSITHQARRMWHQKRLRAPQAELDAFSSAPSLPGDSAPRGIGSVDQQVDRWRRDQEGYQQRHAPSPGQPQTQDFDVLLGILSAEARTGNSQPLAREIQHQWCRRTEEDSQHFLDHVSAAQEAGLIERWVDRKTRDWMELATEASALGPPRPPPVLAPATRPVSPSTFHLADLDFALPPNLNLLTSVQLLSLQFRDDFPSNDVVDPKTGLTGAELVEDVWYKRTTKDKRRGERWAGPEHEGTRRWREPVYFGRQPYGPNNPSPLVAKILELDTPPETPQRSSTLASRCTNSRSRSLSPPPRRHSASSSSSSQRVDGIHQGPSRPRRPDPATRWRPIGSSSSASGSTQSYLPAAAEPMPLAFASSFFVLHVTGIPFYLRSAKHLCQYLPPQLDPDGVHKGARDEQQKSGTIEAWLLYCDFDRAEDAYHFINRPICVQRPGHSSFVLRAERETATLPLCWDDVRRDLRSQFRKQAQQQQEAFLPRLPKFHAEGRATTDQLGDEATVDPRTSARIESPLASSYASKVSPSPTDPEQFISASVPLDNTSDVHLAVATIDPEPSGAPTAMGEELKSVRQ